MKISIIIPNYNGENLLKKNLPKVFVAAEYYLDKEESHVDIIIVDDCSGDNSITEIQSFGLTSSPSRAKSRDNLKLKIIRNEKNLGFSSTVNRGVKEADGEVVILLNTDVRPEKDFLIPLLSHFKDERLFAVGCMDKSIENGKIILRGRGLGKWKKGFLIHERGEVNKTDTLWVSGGSAAFKRSIWEKLGGLDELYNPFYWEDIDISYRAIKSGYKIVFEPKSVVIHEHDEGAIKKKYSDFKIKTIAYRNQFIFAWKNLTDLDLYLLSFEFWVYYHLVKAFIRRDWSFFLGFFKAYVLLPKIFISRFKAKRLFVKSDREVIN
jgi:GT2 family glycosyltransferase